MFARKKLFLNPTFMISPQQFAKLLKASSFTPREQHALLNLLPKLSMDQIQELALVLQHDVEAQKDALDSAKSQRDRLILKFGLDLEKLSGQDADS